ncbi:MAG TPA: hypothetical protein VH369_13470 [Bryobacteraceae bacterium]
MGWAAAAAVRKRAVATAAGIDLMPLSCVVSFFRNDLFVLVRYFFFVRGKSLRHNPRVLSLLFRNRLNIGDIAVNSKKDRRTRLETGILPQPVFARLEEEVIDNHLTVLDSVRSYDAG